MDNWADEKFNLMVEKLVERKRYELDAIKGRNTTSAQAMAIISGGVVKYEQE